MEAALQLACSLNVSNLHDTGRSTDQMPTAAMADELPESANNRVAGSRSVTCRPRWG